MWLLTSFFWGQASFKLLFIVIKKSAIVNAFKPCGKQFHIPAC